MMDGGIIERFRNSYTVNSKNGCWIWQRNLTMSGYGQITFNYIHYRAHRLSYLLYMGNIKKGLLVCHKCDNKKCVNPHHLFLGTPLDNIQDCVNKGRASGKKLPHKTVLKIRNSEKSVLELSNEFKISRSTVYDILNRKTYRNL